MSGGKRTRGRKQSKGRGRKHRGGYTSGTTYGSAVLGSTNSQWDRTFNQNGPNQTSSNAIVGTQYTGSLGYKPYQQAGRRKRTKKGGFWGSVINQAIVPLGLLGLQQRYGKRGKTMRRHRR